MAHAAPGSTDAPHDRPVHEPEHVRRFDVELTVLLERLGGDVVRLVDGKLGLVKLDVEAQIRGYVDGLRTRAIAAVLVAVGVALAAAGLAFAVAGMFPGSVHPLVARACAFGIVGLVGVAAGAVMLKRPVGTRDG